MAVGRSVQFRGIKNVLSAYKNMQIPRWGLFQGTQFLVKYDGKDMNEGADFLEQYLDSMDQRSADGNTYTLCIYEGTDKINSGTKYDASFNFRLADTIDDHVQSRVSGVYEQRIAGLEAQLAEMSEPDEVTPSTQMWNAFAKILEHPQVQQVIATKILGIVDGVSDTIGNIFKKQPVAAAAIGTTSNATTMDENTKLQTAVGMLAQVDPQLGTHLLKLAEIAKADPAKYNMLIGMLKNF